MLSELFPRPRFICLSNSILNSKSFTVFFFNFSSPSKISRLETLNKGFSISTKVQTFLAKHDPIKLLVK